MPVSEISPLIVLDPILSTTISNSNSHSHSDSDSTSKYDGSHDIPNDQRNVNITKSAFQLPLVEKYFDAALNCFDNLCARDFDKECDILQEMMKLQ